MSSIHNQIKSAKSLHELQDLTNNSNLNENDGLNLSDATDLCSEPTFFVDLNDDGSIKVFGADEYRELIQNTCTEDGRSE